MKHRKGYLYLEFVTFGQCVFEEYFADFLQGFLVDFVQNPCCLVPSVSILQHPHTHTDMFHFRIIYQNKPNKHIMSKKAQRYEIILLTYLFICSSEIQAIYRPYFSYPFPFNEPFPKDCIECIGVCIIHIIQYIHTCTMFNVYL